MKLVQLAGLYFLGTEDFNYSNCMMATVILKEKIDEQKLFSSYKELIIDSPLLRTKIIECPEKNKFDWGRFSSEETSKLLDFERKQFNTKYDMETAIKQYYPTNSRLPFYISVVNEHTMVVCMNHIIANGRGFIFWIQKWLQYYSGVKKTKHVQLTASSFGHLLLRMLQKINACLWLPLFLLNFILKTGKAAAQDTVDLSYGKRPGPNDDYGLRQYSFSREDTQKILQKCKQAKMTLTEFMCGMLAQSLLEHDLNKRRVFISIPTDTMDFSPYSPEHTCGNYVASFPAQFIRGSKIAKQVESEFKWIKRGIPYSLSCLFAALSPSYAKVKAQCLALCQKPIPERSPLWDFSITYSSLGIISYPVIEELVEAIYFRIKNQSILLASSTISGKLYMEVSVSKDLYDVKKVFPIFDKILSVNYLTSANLNKGVDNHDS